MLEVWSKVDLVRSRSGLLEQLLQTPLLLLLQMSCCSCAMRAAVLSIRPCTTTKY